MEKQVTYVNPRHESRRLGLMLRPVPSLAWLMLVVFGLAIIGEAGALLAWILIAFWVLRGPDQAVEGLLLALLLVFLNPELSGGRRVAVIARWGIIGEAAIRVAFAWWRYPRRWPSWTGFLLAFVFYTVLSSIFVSWLPIVSLTKVLTYTVIVLIAYLGVKLKGRDWQQTLTTFGVVILLLSLPLVVMPLGYVRNGYEFQGILNHPQAYGVIMSILMAAALGRWLFGPGKKLKFWQLVILLLMGATIVLSGARTGYFALFLALIVTLPLAREARMSFVRLAFNPITYFWLAGVIAYLGIVQPVREFQKVIFEREISAYAPYALPINPRASAFAHLFASRINLISLSWNNFLHSPILGNGFGLPSVRVGQDAVTTIGGLPVSIPYQKGFIGTAVLEEVGVIGLLLLLALIFSQYWSIYKSRNAGALLLFFTVIFVNMGEYIYFASGGIGLLAHIAVAVALVSAEKTIANSSVTMYEGS